MLFFITFKIHKSHIIEIYMFVYKVHSANNYNEIIVFLSDLLQIAEFQFNSTKSEEI